MVNGRRWSEIHYSTGLMPKFRRPDRSTGDKMAGLAVPLRRAPSFGLEFGRCAMQVREMPWSQRFLIIMGLIILGLSLLVASAGAQEASASRPLWQQQERDRIANDVLANSSLKLLAAKGQLRVLSVTPYF